MLKMSTTTETHGTSLLLQPPSSSTPHFTNGMPSAASRLTLYLSPSSRDLSSSVTVGSYAKGSSTYNSLVAAVKTYADGYIAIVQKYTPSNGGLSEQFDKNTGSPLSASDLTWSYAAFMTAADRRAGTVPPSWGEPSANAVPQTCSAAPACMSTITFNENASVNSGQSVYIVGQLTQLGSWDPNSAIPLTLTNGVWTAAISLPAGTTFPYKYIKKTSSGTVTWESDPNRSYTTPSGCGSSATENDSWR